MTNTLASFAKDSFCLLRTPLPVKKRACVWANLLYPSRKMLGFEVSYFERPSHVFLYREIFGRQNYYFQSTNDSPIIFDCGANVGMATLYFKWLYPGARVHAFEPDPSTFAMLQQNAKHNRLANVTTHNCALWDEEGTVEFFTDPAHPGSALMSTDPSRLSGASIRVPSRRLSDFIDAPIDFLKLDVEGAEHRVLADLTSSGKISLVKQMVVEYHHRIAQHRSCLASFLGQLEKAGFEYQISGSIAPVTSQGIPQDILIGAYR